MDGAGYFKIFWRISLPQLRPALAALAIITFTGAWNSYFQPRALIESQQAMTLPIAMDLLRVDAGAAQPAAAGAGPIIALLASSFFSHTTSREATWLRSTK